jgi:hypothetical protein
MPHPPHLQANRPARPTHKRPGRRVASLLLVAGLAASAVTALAASPARAASVCTLGSDTCVITDAVQTPLGPVTITVSAANVVTVQLTPTAPGTLVNIDAFLAPPGAVNRFALPGLAIVSIHPPGPCRVRTSGTAVVFTPVIPPGPPS